ncbi:sigma-54 interaction domain-containing protein [Thermodesulfobacteriota bacterium]
MDSISFGQIEGLFGSPLKLPNLIDELPIGVVILDPHRRVLLLNRAFEVLSGFDREAVWGIPCRHVLRTNICHQKCLAAQANESRGPVTIEGNIINRAHRKINVRLTAVPLHDVAGNVVGFLETVEDIGALQRMNGNIHQTDGAGRLIAQSSKMKELFRFIPVIAQTDSPILITGETGTGKDAVAEVIHNASDRVNGSFVKINCGALPETLMESELFGHKKGAFTGAVSDKMGRLRLAHNGTLYLTEIGDLSLALQVKLLTFLDDKVVYPLGSTNGFQADVRVIAATHRNLERMVQESFFRQDLLFRLNVVRLHLPPLREREGDIGLLLDHFLKTFSAKFGKKPKGLTQQARHFLLNYTYPGNVRELKNIIEYTTNICASELIGMDHLPVYISETGITGQGYDGLGSQAQLLPLKHEDQEEKSRMNWAAIERQLIIDTMIKANGHRSKTAQTLGWGRSTLWRKMKQYGLEKNK